MHLVRHKSPCPECSHLLCRNLLVPEEAIFYLQLLVAVAVDFAAIVKSRDTPSVRFKLHARQRIVRVNVSSNSIIALSVLFMLFMKTLNQYTLVSHVQPDHTHIRFDV